MARTMSEHFALNGEACKRVEHNWPLHQEILLPSSFMINNLSGTCLPGLSWSDHPSLCKRGTQKAILMLPVI